MDELQDRLVRPALGVLDQHGFALAGGYALQAHGLVERMSEDVDLFTDRWDSTEFRRAVDAYQRAGLEVTVVRQADTFARLQTVDTDSARAGSVDLAADRRSSDPALLSIGPVLAESDAVATKVATVFSRGEARDYLDLAGILASGRSNREQLMAMAADVDPGFTPRLVRRSPRRGGPLPRPGVRFLRRRRRSHRSRQTDDALVPHPLSQGRQARPFRPGRDQLQRSEKTPERVRFPPPPLLIT